jgi:hypothetical protein
MKDEWIYYDEPWYNPLVGDYVLAYKESSPDKVQRVLNLEYLVQSEVHFIKIKGEIKLEVGNE